MHRVPLPVVALIASAVGLALWAVIIGAIVLVWNALQ